MSGNHSQGSRASLYRKMQKPRDVGIPLLANITFPPPHEHNGKGQYLPKKLQHQSKLSNELPILAYESQIIRAFDKSDVVIIVAATGGGKSTMVPQYAAKAGYVVTVTQPRRMAAVNLATFVAGQMGTKLGEEVGFRHGYGSCTSSDTKITFLTDGLRLAQELSGHHKVDDNSMLIIDEAHEKNMYMETLIARYLQLRQDPNAKLPKLVIMSATLNVERMRDLFGQGVPVIKVPGRTYPVKELPRGKSIVSDIVDAVIQKKNALVFLPGKKEIRQMEKLVAEQLKERGLQAEVLPLHSKLSSEEQQKTMRKYDIPKVILSTNVAEASLTIPDIDIVIISGEVKRIVIEDGVECLTPMPISKFNLKQQIGRGGRTHDGEFKYHGRVPARLLAPEPPSEIQNSSVASLFLRLLSSPYYPNRESIERLPFPSKISKVRFDQTFKTLQDLNLVGPKGHITTEGKAVACLPVDVRVGKILIAAQQKSVTFTDTDILRNAIDVAAVIQNGGVASPDDREKTWKLLCDEEKRSDAIAQALVFQAGLLMDEKELGVYGIDVVSFKRCKELREILFRRFQLEEVDYLKRGIDDFIHQPLLESVWLGFSDSIFQLRRTDTGTAYVSVNGQGSGQRIIDRDSVLPKNARLIGGMPFDVISYKDPDNPTKIRMIHMATQMDPAWLSKNLPATAQKRLGGILVSERKRKKVAMETGPKFRNQQRGRSKHGEY